MAQTLMGPCPIEVGIDVLPENSMELSLADYHDMVETLAPHRTEETLTEGRASAAGSARF